jgi:ATP-dependent DNA helicase DinG
MKEEWAQLIGDTGGDRLPDTFVLGVDRALILSEGGEVEELSLAEAVTRLSNETYLVINAPRLQRCLGLAQIRTLDILELYAFTDPTATAVPTTLGLAEWLEIKAFSAGADNLEGEALLLAPLAEALLHRVAKENEKNKPGLTGVINYMAGANWPWAAYLEGIIGSRRREGVALWSRLPEWEEGPPLVPPGDAAVNPEEAHIRLNNLLGKGAEDRPEQYDYVAEASKLFAPRQVAEAPNLGLLEAGTGTGKTLGYIAPASLWAEENEGTVWLSTFTKNLQRQIDQELDRLYDNKKDKEKNAVIRKGRENYLCILNLEDALGLVPGQSRANHDRILMGLVLRWLMRTRDGDMVGGDFPAWLGAYFGMGRVLSLTDRRGECVYAACPHYRKCFIERARKKSKGAKLIIANHALVLHEAAAHGGTEGFGARRYVFDEGHHLFDAADSAFSLHLTGGEMTEMRRWLRGRETGKTSRTRGLRARLGDLVTGRAELDNLLTQVEHAAGLLAGEGWLKRVQMNQPMSRAEGFLMAVRAHVFERDSAREGPHGLEASMADPDEGLIKAAKELAEDLEGLAKPLSKLARILGRQLDEEADDLSGSDRARLESMSRSITNRANQVGQGWRPMLGAFNEGTPEGFVDWFVVDRIEGRDYDIGLHRHFIDPTEPFAELVLTPAESVLITSATLRDKTQVEGGAEGLEGDENWRSADVRTGAHHMVMPPKRRNFTSPFDYGEQTRVIIVNDVNKNDPAQVAAAYRELFLAAGGGGLGLFTAIKRLRVVHQALLQPLEEQGISLFGQHVDPMDVGTLVDMFRHDEDACLLGTDALRDGVDVPGRALRMIAFDRVPWPRPTLLHKARRAAFGGRQYDEMLVRLRLKQAFGRLIRKADDNGVFIMLDGATPTRLLDAFPSDVPIKRVGLAEAIKLTGEFLD